MSNELAIYKKNRITEIQNTYNASISRLNTALYINVMNIQYSRLTKVAKQNLINSLFAQYNNNINALKNNATNNIAKIQSFQPKPVIINETKNKNKTALLVGINYTGTSNELFGCINDVIAIKDRISLNGFTNINILTDLTEKKATRDNILLEFKNMLINSKTGDILFFLYSGHGSHTIDKNNDETDGYDELIISCDFQGIIDDELKNLIQTYLKADVTLFAMFDSCFSGSVLDLKYQYLDSLNYDNYTENAKQIDTNGNVLMISGCTDQQMSADSVFNGKSNGAMTWSLLESLTQQPKCSWRELIKNMRDNLKKSQYDQIPQFSSGTFTNIDGSVFI